MHGISIMCAAKVGTKTTKGSAKRREQQKKKKRREKKDSRLPQAFYKRSSILDDPNVYNLNVCVILCVYEYSTESVWISMDYLYRTHVY